MKSEAQKSTANQARDIKNSEVANVFAQYPEQMRENLLFLRQLILDTALESEGIEAVTEILKWGEPSYLTKGGSTVRIDWKPLKPDQYAMYFHCKTRLVDTFKELYTEELNFEGNRAIVFHKNEPIPVNELKHCIALALTYHRRKHLAMLGV